MDFYRALSAKKNVLSLIQSSSTRKNKLSHVCNISEITTHTFSSTDLSAVDLTCTPCKKIPSSNGVGSPVHCDTAPGSTTSIKSTVSDSWTASTVYRSETAAGCQHRSPLVNLQLETNETAPSAISRNSPTHEASSDDDDAFENFLSQMNQNRSPKQFFDSSSSFFTENSDSDSDISDEQLFHCRVDNAIRSTRLEKENVLPILDHFARPLDRDPSRKMAPPSKTYQRSRSVTATSSRAVECAQKSHSEVRTVNSEVRQGTSFSVVADFVCSLYPLDTCHSANKRTRRHPSAERFVKNFKANRAELANRLFRIFNEKVFDKLLPEDMPIVWNSRLLRTAGQCKYLRREIIPRNGEKTVTRLANIELSPKVCTTAERVRDTLLHEACHAAVWIVDGVNDGHGPRWRHWANRAMRTWSGLPMVSVCHAYTIDTRFTYRCTGCGACINRHSKSINTEKQICGRCHSRFELLINTPRGRMMRPSIAGAMDKRLLAHCNNRTHAESGTTLVPTETGQTQKRRPAFADFVRENYKQVRQKPEIKTHADAMTELGNLFKTMRVSNSQLESNRVS